MASKTEKKNTPKKSKDTDSATLRFPKPIAGIVPRRTFGPDQIKKLQNALKSFEKPDLEQDERNSSKHIIMQAYVAKMMIDQFFDDNKNHLVVSEIMKNPTESIEAIELLYEKLVLPKTPSKEEDPDEEVAITVRLKKSELPKFKIDP